MEKQYFSCFFGEANNRTEKYTNNGSNQNSRTDTRTLGREKKN